jgi:hypothetical protein
MAAFMMPFTKFLYLKVFTNSWHAITVTNPQMEECLYHSQDVRRKSAEHPHSKNLQRASGKTEAHEICLGRCCNFLALLFIPHFEALLKRE